MKIVVAPDSFKGSNSSVRVAEIIERGVRVIFPDAEIVRIPVADGGEGTVEAVIAAAGGEYRDVEVTGPLGERVTARYGLLPGGRGVIEMAAASGLPLVPAGRRDPEQTTTFGTGELILDALDQGCTEILIGVGGSATNDAGMGMAQALGFSFLDSAGREVGRGGKHLAEVEAIDTRAVDPRLASCLVTVACDVRNPLFGEEGAAHVYGPQKGADGAMIERLDRGLRRIAERIERDLGASVAEVPGAGAAGGLGAGLLAFCGAELKSGIDAVLDIVRFDEMVAGAGLVITGEGAMDGSTAYGKVPVGIARRAKRSGAAEERDRGSGNEIPVVAVVGNIGKGASNVYRHGIDAIMSTVNGAMPLSEALDRSVELLEEASERLMRIVRVGMRLS